jgi:hypothetical protein
MRIGPDDRKVLILGDLAEADNADLVRSHAESSPRWSSS